MLFLYKPEICLKCHCFMQNCISMICYKKMRPTVFHHFLNLVGVWEVFSYRVSCSPPYLHPFSDFTFKEVVGAEEPVHWEAPPKGNLNLEVNM